MAAKFWKPDVPVVGGLVLLSWYDTSATGSGDIALQQVSPENG